LTLVAGQARGLLGQLGRRRQVSEGTCEAALKRSDSATPIIQPAVRKRRPTVSVQKLESSAPKPINVMPTNESGRMPNRRTRIEEMSARKA
jgi:hypothetical protein